MKKSWIFSSMLALVLHMLKKAELSPLLRQPIQDIKHLLNYLFWKYYRKRASKMLPKPSFICIIFFWLLHRRVFPTPPKAARQCTQSCIHLKSCR